MLMDTAAPRSLVTELYEITADTVVTFRVPDGQWVTGKPSRLDRDEAGIRLEICPYDGDAPQYRVRAMRTPAGWLDPYVERRYRDREWEHYGSLAAIAKPDELSSR